ncbi:tripartite tricarboxylate transporter substrate binding protein [Variovorax sp. LjRoot290]|uniref:Bug family tripartite tricarboxylate transporter substrate binding protein n=1 Tax=Variovorax sp. LjRoot290 TaxID=3342316 RepID=UPI003ED0BBEE
MIIKSLRTGLAACLCAVATLAAAQTWPDRPIRIVVPAPPGGSIDVIARIMADAMQPGLGQPIIVDNKPGGLGMLGVNELLGAPRDGYTVMMHLNGAVSEIPHLTKSRFDPFKDIKPIAELARSGLLFVGGPQVPANTLKEVIAHVKANPGKVSIASYSTGTVSHTLGVELNALAGLDMQHVGYKGAAPALQDVMAGHVPLMFDGPGTSVPMVKAGKVKAFAVTSSQRMPALPDVPTFAEQGFPTMTQDVWVGLWVANGVPAAVQDRLREAALKALQQPAVRGRLSGLGMEPGQPATPDELAKSLRVAHERQGALLKSINFKPD